MAKGLMDNLIPMLLVGGGGYLLWRWYENNQAASAVAGGSGVTTNGASATGGNYAVTGGTLTNGGVAPVGTQGGGTAQQNTQPSGASALTNLKQAILSHVGPGQEMNFWQWNYQIQAVGGTDPGTLDPWALDGQLAGMAVEDVQNVLYTFDEWWSRVRGPLGQYFSSQGLSGPPMTTTQLMFARGGRYGIPGVGHVRSGIGNLETARASEVAVSRGIQQAQAAQARARIFSPRGPRWVN